MTHSSVTYCDWKLFLTLFLANVPILFIIFGFIPVLVYLICYWSKYEEQGVVFAIDCVFTLLTIMALGYFQAVITKQPKLIGIASLTLNGLVSTGIAFCLGYGIEKSLK